jgi:flagellar hook-associated protein 2
VAISSPGIGSNLDVNSIVTQLMAIEKQPINLLTAKEARFTAELSAVGSMKGALSSLQSAAAGLATASKFVPTKKATPGDATVLTASATSTAAVGSYQLNVTQLAQANKLRSVAFATQATAVGSGTITIQFGSVAAGVFTANGNRGATNIAIPAGKSSLTEIKDAINAAKAGVTASIVNDGTGYRLSLSSDFSGTENALKVTVADDDGNHTNASGLSQLVYDPATAGVKNLAESQEAKDAKFTIDGIAIVKASNVVTDVIDGLTINLLKEGASTTLAVSADKSAVRTTIEAFVKAYNDTNKTLRDLGSFNAETKKAGTLQGDPTLRTVQAQLKSLLTGQLSFAGGGLRTLSDIGIAFQRDGSLTLNATKLNAVLDDPTKDVSTLFASVGKASDSLIEVTGTPTTVQPGRYPVEITRLATQGFATDTIASTTVTAGVNSSFGLTINGTAVTVTLNAGVYTQATLAAEIQSKINGSATVTGAGLKVEVSATAGTLRIESSTYGSSSTIAGLSSALLAGTPSTTAGVDVAGSIGALPGTGSGQDLTGDGNPEGLKIKVKGGAVGVGVDRGTVVYEAGFAARIDKLLSGILDSKGTLSGKTDSINSSIKAINQQADVLARRMVQIEARYRRQFTSLDTLLSGFNKTSTFLQQQLSTLNASSN